MGVRVLHYSGHGEESFLAFEDGMGGTHKLTPQLLASTCLAGSRPEGLGGVPGGIQPGGIQPGLLVAPVA